MASNRSRSPNRDWLKIGPNETLSDVAKVMEEFHCLYNEKLKNLDSPCADSSEQKVTLLQDWVRDLSDQNKMLVKTVELLEKNAVDRVDTLDNVLKVRALEKQESVNCKDCPDMFERFQKLQSELECTRRSACEKECMIKECIKKNEELSKAMCAMQAKTTSDNNLEAKCCDLEQTILDYQRQLCILEKAICAETEEKECLKQQINEHEKLMDQQQCKIELLEDNVRYYQQSIKQKDLTLERLKEHIRQLRLAMAPNKMQDRGMISRSSSTEENYYYHSDTTGSIAHSSFCMDEAVMAGGDSALVEELRKKLVNEKDMQVALTSEIAEKHDAIMRLKEHVRELEEQLRQSDMQTHFKDDIIRQLRKEVKLGRAKESLAEMLGLKGGPRAQMKAKIDNLHSELEEREIEISQLEGKLEASRLPAVEAKLNRLEVELVDRERSVLALCDKLDYVRKYLSKLRGSDEDISIKCGLEALLLELSEDVEWTREARRNVSIPLNEDPKESVIIINHRSHSLPDTTLQKQVQALKNNTDCTMVKHEGCGQSMKETNDTFSLKEQITNLESGLSESLSQLGVMWESMKKCELECGDSVMRLTQDVQNTVENEHSQLLQVNNEMQNIAERINEWTSLGENNDYLVHCLEKCLVESLESLSKQKESMGVSLALRESSLNLLNNDVDVPSNLKFIVSAEENVNDAVCLLQQLKARLLSKDANKIELSACKTKEMNNVVNGIISSKQNVVDQLYLIHLTQEEIAKRIFKKFTEFDKIFMNHQDNVKGLRFVLNHFIFNDFVSNSVAKKGVFVYHQSIENKYEDSSPNSELKICTPTGGGDSETKRIKALKKSRLSRSSPSIGEEYVSDILGDICVKGAHLHQIAMTLNEEFKLYLKELFIREDEVRRFVFESQDLNKTLDNLNKELCSSQKILMEKMNALSVQALQVVIGQAQTEVELLLYKSEDLTMYKEMYDMNRSKMEQDIQGLQRDMLAIVSDILETIKASQDYDNNLLNSYRNKIQNYREKVEQLEKHLTNSIDHNELEEKDDEEDLVCKLSDKIEKYQSEVDQLRRSINLVKKDKEAVEMENQKVMEELQAKICSLQAALQNDTQQDHPVSAGTKSWFLSWPNSKQIHSRHVHDV